MSSEQDNGEKRPRKRVIKESALEDIGDGVPNKRRGRSAADKKDSDKNTNGDETPTKEPAKEAKAKRVSHQILTERDFLPKLWNSKECEDSSFSFKICSWNVAGLRALLRNHPEALNNLVKDYDIDLLCLQETKLQDSHLDDVKQPIRASLLQPDYDAYYSCSTAKKGYAGTAVFVKRRHNNAHQPATKANFFAPKTKDKSITEERTETQAFANLIPVDVAYKMGVIEHDQEGRLIKVDFPLFSVINCYIPNSGQKLERLDYRTERWDKDFLKFVQAQPKPSIWLGDLNVAHTNLEVWNDGAKHLATQAGVTQQERDSFQHQLDTSGFRDAFRFLHPTAKGCYSYWSQRAGNRKPNKGLRLDYFCCAPYFFDEASQVLARDCYILHEVYGSDHCPVMLELEIKK